MKMSRQIRVVMATLIGGIAITSSGCSAEALTANEASGPLGPEQTAVSSMAHDGTYSITIDPTVPNTFVMAGGGRLEIPAGAVCALGISGYGPTFWDTPCDPEPGPVELTVTVNSTDSAGASVDFAPDLRFSPASNVVLTLSAPNVSQQDVKDWIIVYCPTATSTTSGNGAGGVGGGKDGNKCVNESLTDRDLRTEADYDRNQLFRRIKHFSLYAVRRGGYLLAE
jgi:hypothetical protein